MRMPIQQLGNRADHTYVKCSTGRARWGCFGPRRGGSRLKQGRGSTRRANQIAGSDGRANLRCYLVNGVCHQAANRILLPAARTVSGARGYRISRALFGTYGKTRGPFGICRSPFVRYGGISGDLTGCIETRPDTQTADAAEVRSEQEDIGMELDLYGRAEWEWDEDLAVALFSHMVTRYVPTLAQEQRDELTHLRQAVERGMLDAAHSQEEAPSFSTFAEVVDDWTSHFQREAAAVLDEAQYQSLFDLGPDETILLSDPTIVDRMVDHRDEHGYLS